MRKKHANYEVIAQALRPHQLETLRDYAEAYGADPYEWPDLPLCCTVATALAVRNLLNGAGNPAPPARKVLLEIAAHFDLDPETLLRQWRERRRRTNAEK